MLALSQVKGQIINPIYLYENSYKKLNDDYSGSPDKWGGLFFFDGVIDDPPFIAHPLIY